jgi:hypothetical protein
VLRYGSQATIMVFTDDNPILNGLGRLWMRIVSILSYLR